MRGNIVLAAAVAGLSAILACAILLVGARWALLGAADRLAVSVDRHAENTRAAGERAGELAGAPIAASLNDLGKQLDAHARAVDKAGESIAAARVTLLGPVQITDHEPLRVRGTADDGSVPITVRPAPKSK